MNPPSSEIARYAELDARMVRAARGLRLLSLVSWPVAVQEAFLAGWRRNDVALPRYEYPRHDFGDAAPVLAPPRWLPRWLSRANGLAGMLAFSLFANRIRLERIEEGVPEL